MIRAVLKLPFLASFYVFKFLGEFLCGVQIWAKHSLLDETFLPFKSDIDVCFYSTSFAQEKKIAAFFKIVKKLIPVFGELSGYNAVKISFLAEDFLNGFEIDRDPLLKEKLSFCESHLKSYTKNQAAAFLFASAQNDLKNLTVCPKKRMKKWLRHFEKINTQVPLKIELNSTHLLFSIVTAVVNLNSYADSQLAVQHRSQILLSFYGITHSDWPLWLKDLAQSDLVFWLYFPEYLTTVKAPRFKLNAQLLAIFICQIEWRLLCILRESYTDERRKDFLARLSGFENLVLDFLIENPAQELNLLLIKIRKMRALIATDSPQAGPRAL